MKHIKQQILNELESIENDVKTHGHDYQLDLHLIKDLCKTLYYVEEACEIMDKFKPEHRKETTPMPVHHTEHNPMPASTKY